MNKIFSEVKQIMQAAVKEYLPEISLSDLEDNGAVYYMNGKNGTEFDWYVNEKISDFMMFYNDEDNMGAVKATLYNDGGLLMYVYGEQGKSVPQKIDSYLDVTEEEVLALAVFLRNEADDKKIWDADIEKVDSNAEPDATMVKEFVSNAHDYDDMRERKALLGQIAYVSKRIMDEGWKIGYMYRDEVVKENDSGWVFMAGNEEDEYTADYRNIQLMSIHSVLQYDGAIWKYITAPVGTRLIRVSAEAFEVDDNTKEIYMEKM